MGKKRYTRYKWRGYVQAIVREYPELEERAEELRKNSVAFREYNAVQRAIRETEQFPDGALRLRLLDMVFWRQSHNMQGAANVCYVSQSTAYRWRERFLYAVAENMGIADKKRRR